MKNIVLSILMMSSSLVMSQIKTNLNVSQNTISNQSAFLDASSYPNWNSKSNIGKGLVFPRTDLQTLKTLVAVPDGLPTSFPHRLDGMVVYNTVSGTAGIGGTKVEPGFYYYENKSQTLNGGTWKPFNSFANSSVKLGSISDTASTADKTCKAEKAGTIHYEEVSGSGVFGFCIKRGDNYVWAYIKGGSNLFGTSANGATFGEGL